MRGVSSASVSAAVPPCTAGVRPAAAASGSRVARSPGGTSRARPTGLPSPRPSCAAAAAPSAPPAGGGGSPAAAVPRPPRMEASSWLRTPPPPARGEPLEPSGKGTACGSDHGRRGFGWTRRSVQMNGSPPENRLLVPYGGGIRLVVRGDESRARVIEQRHGAKFAPWLEMSKARLRCCVELMSVTFTSQINACRSFAGSWSHAAQR